MPENCITTKPLKPLTEDEAVHPPQGVSRICARRLLFSLLSCYKIQPLGLGAGLPQRIRVPNLLQPHPRIAKQPPDLFYTISSLKVRLLVFSVKVLFFPYKQGQIILIDSVLRVIPVFPDKASFVPILRNDGLSQNLFIFIESIQIEEKNPSWIQIIINQANT